MSKRFNIVLGTLVLIFLLLFGIATCSVKAQELPQETINVESEKSAVAKLFDKEIQDKIINFAIALTGTLTGLFTCYKAFKNMKNSLETTSKSNELSINKTKKIIDDGVLKIEEKLNELGEVETRLIQMSEENYLKLVEENEKTKELSNRLVKAFRMIYINDHNLVKSGLAKELAKVLGDIDENDKA